MSPQDLENILVKNNQDFVYPRYDGYSLYNVMPTIFKLFGLNTDKTTLPDEVWKRYAEGHNQKIVLFLTDGFGYNQAKEIEQPPILLKKLFDSNNFFPITSVFPSTTAASLTTLATGLTPQEHGLFEWNLYFPEIDQIIQTLPFSHVGKKAMADELLNEGVSPNILLDKETIYEQLGKKGIKSYIFTSNFLGDSVYSSLSTKGANTITYRYFSDLVVSFLDFLENVSGPSFAFFYWHNIDGEGHTYGPKSKQYATEVQIFFANLQKFIIEKVSPENLKNTLFLLTSDHGQTTIYPEETVYLNDDKSLLSALSLSRNGRQILPYGNPRDVFLNVKNEKIEEVIEHLKQRYGQFLSVFKIAEMVKKGLFGIGNPSDRFLQRAGNVLLLPNKNNTMWYQYIKGEKIVFKGNHGGLSEEEMLIPFAIAKFSELV